MSDRDTPTRHCWFDFENGYTCMLLEDHDGPHGPTPDGEVIVAFRGPDDD